MLLDVHDVQGILSTLSKSGVSSTDICLCTHIESVHSSQFSLFSKTTRIFFLTFMKSVF